MLNKKPKATAKDIATKRQLSKWQKESHRRRILLVAIVVAIVSIPALLVYGYYVTYQKPWHEPILQVNNKVFDMNYYVKMLRLFGVTKNDTSSAEYLVNETVNYELYRQAADKLGIISNITSADKVEAKLQEYVAAYNGTIDQLLVGLKNLTISEAEFKQMYIEPMLLQQGLEDYFFENNVTKEAEQVKVQAMLLGTAEEALEVMAEWNAGGNFTQLAANETYSISHVYDDEWLPVGIVGSATFDNATFNATLNADNSTDVILQRDTTYSTTGGYWLTKIIGENQTGAESTVHLLGMLLDSRADAELIAANATTDAAFAQYARLYSLDSASKDSGGDLGWLSANETATKFESANLSVIANLQPYTVSEPIYQKDISKYGGYWLIKVLDREIWPLSDEHRQTFTATYFNDWLAEQKSSGVNEIVNYLDADNGYQKLNWALEHI